MHGTYVWRIPSMIMLSVTDLTIPQKKHDRALARCDTYQRGPDRIYLKRNVPDAVLCGLGVITLERALPFFISFAQPWLSSLDTTFKSSNGNRHFPPGTLQMALYTSTTDTTSQQ